MNTETDTKQPDFTPSFWAGLLVMAALFGVAFYFAFRKPDYQLRIEHRDAVSEARVTGQAKLLKCPVCRKDVSSAADKCPHCGNPQ